MLLRGVLVEALAVESDAGVDPLEHLGGRDEEQETCLNPLQKKACLHSSCVLVDIGYSTVSLNFMQWRRLSNSFRMRQLGVASIPKKFWHIPCGSSLQRSFRIVANTNSTSE